MTLARVVTTTAFLAGLLLFWVEPMVARMLLPAMGGSAVVWNTCTAFFQTLLLVASVYAHLGARVGPRRQALLHLAVVALCAATLPVRIPPAPDQSESVTPLFWILCSLVTTVGPPFFALAATASLLTQWLGATRGPRIDPSLVLSASNAGSLAALITYPLAVEPALGLGHQSRGWAGGYAVFLSFITVSALILTKRGAPTSPAASPGGVGGDGPCPAPSWTTRGLWLGLSLVPSMLLLSVTTHLTHEIPSVPLLWIVPLTLYLGTLVIAFLPGTERWTVHCHSAQPLLIAMVSLVMFLPLRVPGFTVHLVTLFVVSLGCHGRLAALAGPPSQKSEFVLWMYAGGAAGGLFCALAAPVLFSWVAEYPIALVAACLLRPRLPDGGAPPGKGWKGWPLDLGAPALLAAVTLIILWFLPRLGDERDVVARVAILLQAGAVALLFRLHPLRFALGMVAVLVGGFVAFQSAGTLMMVRSPYGVCRIVDDGPTHRRLLFHGTTIHGGQELAGPSAGQPVAYHRPSSPLGRLLTGPHGQTKGRRIAVVGLGVGAVAYYASASREVHFFEIDPAVRDIAVDRRWFSFMSARSPWVRVTLGDGRLSLARHGGLPFDLIALDAFSSDAVPTHLLTREACATYLRALAPGGALAFNTANRHVDLQSLVVTMGRSWSLQVRVVSGTRDDPNILDHGTWAVLTRTPSEMQAWTQGDDRWAAPGPPVIASPWTDDRSSLTPVLRW